MLCGITKIKKKKIVQRIERLQSLSMSLPLPSHQILYFFLKYCIFNNFFCFENYLYPFDGDMLDRVLERLKALPSSIKLESFPLS